MRNLENGIEVEKTSKDDQHKLEAQPNSTSTLSWPSGPVSSKMDAQDASDSVFDDPHMVRKLIP